MTRKGRNHFSIWLTRLCLCGISYFAIISDAYAGQIPGATDSLLWMLFKFLDRIEVMLGLITLGVVAIVCYFLKRFKLALLFAVIVIILLSIKWMKPIGFDAYMESFGCNPIQGSTGEREICYD